MTRSRGTALLLAGATACALAAGVIAGCSHPAPKAAPAPRTAAQPGIYTLLPFSQAQLGTAYTAAARASSAYETFTWTDTPAAYGNRAAAWVTPSYLTYLEQTFGNATAEAARSRAHEHSTATSSVLSIRTFGPASITFIVSITQTDPDTNDSGGYAVTTQTTDGTHWQVNDIEPAAAGNS